jgi:hypothetical protein
VRNQKNCVVKVVHQPVKMKILIVVSVLFLTWTVQSARILGVFPVPGKSNYFLGSSLMRALAEKGHDVTIISPFSENNLPKGGSYREILLPEMLAQLETRRNEINMYELGEVSPFINIPFLAYLMSEIGEILFKETNVQKLINSGEKFDAVIVEQFFSDAHKVLAYHFDAVQIVFSSVGANIWINSLVGNPSPPSYIPDSMLSYSAHMTFLERLKNTLISLLNTCVHHLYLYPKHNGIIRKYFPNGPDVHDVLYNASLVLLNSHPSLNQPVPHVPNMIEIGGFHIKPPKQLPQDLEEFLDNAKDGVIYFSMGSNLRSADLPSEKRDAILKAFSKFKQKILWKWEDDVLPGQPDNVKLGKWFPQQEVLAHPNVRLFITHGGLLSSIETVYFGVPILVIPIYGDQKLNAQLAIGNGYGLSLSYDELNEENLFQKLNELIENPKYRKNVRSKSSIFHDRPVKPLEKALYWVDYVIRHKGAPHLKVAATELPWYKYLLLDVIVVLTVIVSLGTIIMWLFLKKIYQKLYSKSKQRKLKKN